jgi:hypothetical protein
MRYHRISSGPDGGLCLPIDKGDMGSETRMFVITLLAERAFWFPDGQPCAVPYELVAQSTAKGDALQGNAISAR